jgi:hypothetical protein
LTYLSGGVKIMIWNTCDYMDVAGVIRLTLGQVRLSVGGVSHAPLPRVIEGEGRLGKDMRHAEVA